MAICQTFYIKATEIRNILLVLHLDSRLFYRAPFTRGEESPGSAGHWASEMGDVREGIVRQKKKTASIYRGKGEKVG